MRAEEIILPITEPETEWVRGRALQKMSPKRDHSRIQTVLAARLDAWALGRGEVGTEWRFRIAIPGGPRRPLVPDIAFVSIDELRGRTHAEIQVPDFAPTVAIEVLSPGDDERDIADKTAVYLAGGTKLVIVVDPASRSVRLDDGSASIVLDPDATLRHPALPEFELGLADFFRRALDLSI